MSWNQEKISDVAIIGDGAHASIKRVKTGVPYLTSKNFKADGLDLTKLDFISESDYQKHFKEKSKALTKQQEDDLVVGIIGTLGAPYLVRKTDHFGLSSSVAILRPDKEKILPKYLLYWMRSPIFQNSINQIKSGVAQSFLSLGMIGSLPVNYPQSLDIQQRIAGILSAYDDLIETNLKRIKLLEEMAQITYEEWFVRLRFPNHESTPINPETALPEGWKKKENGDCCEVSGGGTPSREVPKYWECGDIKWFSPTDLTKSNSLCLLDSSDKITELGLKKSSAKIMGSHTFMMTSRATIGLFGLIDAGYSTNQGFINVTPLKATHKYYLLFNFKYRVDEFIGHATGATFPEISKSKFKKLKIVWPSENLISDFDRYCSPIISEMMNLAKQNIRLREARDILMPRLMTGVIDVESYHPALLLKEAA